MTQQEIQDRLNKKMSDFMNEACPMQLVDWFWQKFEGAFMVMNQAQVPFRMYTVQSVLNKIGSKSIDTITRHEAGFMAEVWLSVQPITVDKDIRRFLVKRASIEQLKATLDTDLIKKKESVEREQLTLLKTSQIKKLISV